MRVQEPGSPRAKGILLDLEHALDWKKGGTPPPILTLVRRDGEAEVGEAVGKQEQHVAAAPGDVGRGSQPDGQDEDIRHDPKFKFASSTAVADAVQRSTQGTAKSPGEDCDDKILADPTLD